MAMSERLETKAAMIKFGTLFEVNPQTNAGRTSRVDMVLAPYAATYFSSIQTVTDNRDRFILVPTGIGTAYSKNIGSILDERIGLIAALNGFAAGLEKYAPGVKLDILTILRFLHYSRMPAVEIKYVEVPEERYIPR